MSVTEEVRPIGVEPLVCKARPEGENRIFLHRFIRSVEQGLVAMGASKSIVRGGGGGGCVCVMRVRAGWVVVEPDVWRKSPCQRFTSVPTWL